MKYKQYLKHDAIKNYFPLPNEIFMLGLCAGEISVYSYLLFLENRKTYQCWPSYKTIGKAVDMSQNTVRKYVMALEEKMLIRTEQTTIYTKSSLKRNGNLLYTIRPIQEALELFYERQMAQAELAAQRQRAAQRLEKLASVGPCEPLCGALEAEASPTPPRAKPAKLTRFGTRCGGRKTKQDKGRASQAHPPGHNCPQCGQFRGRRRES